MKNKFILLVFLLLIVPNVIAIGVTPGRTSIDFSSNLEREVSFSILNTEEKDMDIAFSVSGDLADYISISNDIASISKGEASKDFSYNLKLPNGLSPGLHKANVVALDVPEKGEDGELVVKATVSVVTQVYVYVPYPGKYIEAKLDVVNNLEENSVDFFVPFISRGEDDLNSVEAILEIYKGEEKIETINTNKLSAKTNERKELVANWNPSVEPGKYRVVANVKYDEKVQVIEKEFNYGGEDLDVLGVSVNDFKLGDVARIRILVQNQLSDSIEDVFANLKIYDLEFERIADLKSENYDIAPSSNEEIIIYWDTEEVSKGEYNSELDIKYQENLINKNFKMDVLEDSIKFTGVGFVVSSGGSGKTNITTILFIVVGLLVLINLLWFFWYMNNKKKTENLNAGGTY